MPQLAFPAGWAGAKSNVVDDNVTSDSWDLRVYHSTYSMTGNEALMEPVPMIEVPKGSFFLGGRIHTPGTLADSTYMYVGYSPAAGAGANSVGAFAIGVSGSVEGTTGFSLAAIPGFQAFLNVQSMWVTVTFYSALTNPAVGETLSVGVFCAQPL